MYRSALPPSGSGQWYWCIRPPHFLGSVGIRTPTIQCLTAWGSGQWNSYNTVPHCFGAVGSGTPAIHCLTIWGQWVVQLLQYTTSPPRGSGQCKACNALLVPDIVDEPDNAHAAVAPGYRDWARTRRAGWPSRFRGPRTLPPWPKHMQRAQKQISEGMTLHDIPDEAVLVQEACWYPNHAAVGGLVVADLETGMRQAYTIPIPVHVDGSY